MVDTKPTKFMPRPAHRAPPNKQTTCTNKETSLQMPDIAFHLSSETADANGHCPGGDRTKITLPLEPALQIPIDAKPVAWLHNLAFSNAIANVSASDGSDSLVLGTGDGACNFQKGDTAGINAWIGIRYEASDGTQ